MSAYTEIIPFFLEIYSFIKNASPVSSLIYQQPSIKNSLMILYERFVYVSINAPFLSFHIYPSLYKKLRVSISSLGVALIKCSMFSSIELSSIVGLSTFHEILIQKVIVSLLYSLTIPVSN